MKDKSLEEINILKLIVYTLSFISLCTALILFLLLPMLENYKANDLRENLQIALLNNVKAKLNASESKVQELRLENNQSLMQFENPIDSTALRELLNSHFKEVKLNRLDINQSEPYLQYAFKVETSIKSPKNFYDFIDALSTYKNLMKIDYPITLKAAKEAIMISFVIKLYSN